ncbi:MAG: RecQ family ATP-dependent DNA helicase, partial [Verrucomicrobiota bacterium JB024]|nr:RecQ family ATP-dependent DNA helicase [Verrucomicrobiota bacterium JB024]
MGWVREAREVLKEHFGFGDFRDPQQQVVASILARRDTLVIMPTGGGKSLCYQLPALMMDGVTLVISPLIALMKDQVDALQARGIPAAMVNSSQGWEEQKDVLERMRRGELKLVYVSPERFRAGSFVRALETAKIAMLAIDEAHCISQWGHDFRPDYMRLGQVLEQLGRPLCSAFTATATPDVREDIQRQLGLKDPAVFVSGFARDNLSFNVNILDRKIDKSVRLRKLIEQHGTGIIYCATRKSVEAVSAELKEDRIAHTAYHAGLSINERKAAQEPKSQGYDITALEALPLQPTRRDAAVWIWSKLSQQPTPDWPRWSKQDADNDQIPDLQDPLPFTTGRVSWKPNPARDGIPDATLL